MKHIGDVVLTTNSNFIEVTNLPSNINKDLFVIFRARADQPIGYCQITINGSSSLIQNPRLIYTDQNSNPVQYLSGTDNSFWTYTAGTNNGSGVYSQNHITFYKYSNTNVNKYFSAIGGVGNASQNRHHIQVNSRSSSDPITSFRLTNQNGNFVAGTRLQVYAK